MMATINSKPQRTRTFAGLGLGLGTMLTVALLMQVKKELDTGLSPVLALGAALRHNWIEIGVILLDFAVVGAIYLYMVERNPPVTADAMEAGRVHWSRKRRFLALMMLPAFLISAVQSFMALPAGQWKDGGGLSVGLTVCFGAIILGIWMSKPGRDYLYFLGSGDSSRMNDERAQLIAGKAAGTTLTLLTSLVFVVGTAYEILVMGPLPWRSLLCVLGFQTVYAVSHRYWQSKY